MRIDDDTDAPKRMPNFDAVVAIFEIESMLRSSADETMGMINRSRKVEPKKELIVWAGY